MRIHGCTSLWTSQESSNNGYAYYYYLRDIDSNYSYEWKWTFSTSSDSKLNIKGVFAVRKYKAGDQ